MVIVEAEAGEFGDAELFAQDARGVVGLEDPVFEPGFDATNAIGQRVLRGIEERLRTGKQRFTWTQKLKLVAQIVGGARAGELSRLKLSSREIDEG